jgi:hypothetical protein
MISNRASVPENRNRKMTQVVLPESSSSITQFLPLIKKVRCKMLKRKEEKREIAVTTFEKGYGDECVYYFSTDHAQPITIDGFVPVTQYCFSRALVKAMLDESGAKEIPNPDPDYQI